MTEPRDNAAWSFTVRLALCVGLIVGTALPGPLARWSTGIGIIVAVLILFYHAWRDNG